ncbi:MAG: hypothetical protein K6E58_00825 [Eubacterium sp.]|nr:hypothetical protein [Eubacterium sp.]
MKKIYKTPELELTKFEVFKDVMGADDPGNIITNPWTTSDPDETIGDFDDWDEW